MNYTLNQILIFVKVVQFKSITKAAIELNLTQPAVSIQLKNFQDQFDIPLTEVIGRQIYITDFGEQIAKAANNIINEIDEISYKTASFKGKLSGKLRFSIVSTAKYVMPYYLSGFVEKHKEIDLFIDVTNKKKVIESLVNNEIDFALVSILPDHLSINQYALLSNKLYLIGNSNAIKIDSNEPHDIFGKIPMIYRELGSGTRQTMETFFYKNNINVKMKMELTSNEAVKQAIIAGLGYSIMPIIGVKNELLNKELQIIPVKGLPIKTSWNLIWLKDKKLSPVAEAFLKHLQSNKSKIYNKYFSCYS